MASVKKTAFLMMNLPDGRLHSTVQLTEKDAEGMKLIILAGCEYFMATRYDRDSEGEFAEVSVPEETNQ